MKKLHFDDYKPFAKGLTKELFSLVPDLKRLHTDFTFTKYTNLDIQFFCLFKAVSRLCLKHMYHQTKEQLAEIVYGLTAYTYPHINSEMKIYKISKYFGHVLNAASCDVKKKYLGVKKNELKFLCIEFPDDLIFDTGNNEFAKCAYVVITPRDSLFCELHDLSDDMNERERVDVGNMDLIINICMPLYKKDGEIIEGSQLLSRIRLDNDEDIDQQIKNFHQPEVTKFVLKCLLYIESGDPDLTQFKPAPPPTNNSKLKKWRRHNEYSTEVIRVGFNYQKPILYNVDQTSVRGHWRWQPCGPNLELLKLIFINEHIRHFKNNEPIEELRA